MPAALEVTPLMRTVPSEAMGSITSEMPLQAPKTPVRDSLVALADSRFSVRQRSRVDLILVLRRVKMCPFCKKFFTGSRSLGLHLDGFLKSCVAHTPR